jgi:adenosylcobinamide-GDP ribazoletransferase
MLLAALRALLQFCTVLPLGPPVEFDEFACRSYLYPLGGYAVGGIAALLIFLLPPTPIAAAFALGVVLLVSGLHHFDGLLDFGDGAMAHGSREKRIAALTDRQVGAGGLGLGIVVTLVAFAGLTECREMTIAILAAEVGAKLAMALLTVWGEPFKEGMQNYLHSKARWWFPIPAALLALPMLLLPISPAILAAAGAAILIVVVGLLLLSRRLFGGVNGDIVGTANEMARTAVIVTIALAGG